MTRRLRLSGIALVMILGRGVEAAAQGVTTEQMLARAVASLDATDIELGFESLRQLLPILQAGSSKAARVNAYTRYAEASWALGYKDSLAAPFAAAVREDPFLELDPDRFNPDLQSAFRAAKRRVIVVGVAAPRDTTLAPNADGWPVSIAVGQPGPVRLRLRRLDTPGKDSVVATVSASGVTRAVINLTDAGRGTLEPGAYRLTAVFGEDGSPGPESVVEFDVARQAVDTFPYEPPIAPGVLRPESHRGSLAMPSLLRGLGFAALVGVTPILLSNSKLEIGPLDGRALFVGVAIGIAGVTGARLGRPTVPIPDNIAYNKSLRDARDQRNSAIGAQNEVRRRFAPLRITLRGSP